MAEDPVFQLVARSIDPYSSESNQQSNLKTLCARIAKTCNERATVIGLLTHRILSPDQNEAFNALNALEFISTNSDVSIFEELNKLSTLNAFIQLLSPEHQGQQTTGQNKDKATALLSAWKNAAANVENISKVYSILCSRKLINSKASSFDSSIKPKSVETHQQSVSLNNQRQLYKNNSDEIAELIRMKAQILNDLFDTVDAGHQLKNENLLHEMYIQLVDVRPMLFHFTVDASNKQDHEMVEILALNDHLNSIINRYRLNGSAKPPHPDRDVGVRFDPEITKTDRISHVHRKPTPHSKAGCLLTDTDFSKLLATDSKRLSNSSINEEVENLELNDSN